MRIILWKSGFSVGFPDLSYRFAMGFVDLPYTHNSTLIGWFVNWSWVYVGSVLILVGSPTTFRFFIFFTTWEYD